MSDVKPLTAEEIKTYKECLYPLPTPLKRALATIHSLDTGALAGDALPHAFTTNATACARRTPNYAGRP